MTTGKALSCGVENHAQRVKRHDQPQRGTIGSSGARVCDLLNRQSGKPLAFNTPLDAVMWSWRKRADVAISAKAGGIHAERTAWEQIAFMVSKAPKSEPQGCELFSNNRPRKNRERGLRARILMTCKTSVVAVCCSKCLVLSSVMQAGILHCNDGLRGEVLPTSAVCLSGERVVLCRICSGYPETFVVFLAQAPPRAEVSDCQDQLTARR